MVKGKWYTEQVLYMMVSGLKVLSLVEEYIFFQMGVCMMALGLTTLGMVKENKIF